MINQNHLFHFFITTNKASSNNKKNQIWECNNLFKALIKKNIKYIQFDQFLNYCTHNKIEIKVSPKIRLKTKGTIVMKLKYKRQFHGKILPEQYIFAVPFL